MNNTITAQELKVKGMSILDSKTKKYKEAFLTIRGEKSFVVLTIDQYNYLRECELDAALKQSEEDIKAGRFSIMSVEDHIKSLKNV